RAGRFPLERGFRDDQVRPAFDPPDQVRECGGVMREVGVHQDGAVPAGPIRTVNGHAEELFDRGGVALPLAVGDYGERQDPRVRRQHLRGRIARAVVGDEELVFTGKRREHLADFPEQEPDGTGFIMAGYADVDHSSRSWESPNDTRGSSEVESRSAAALSSTRNSERVNGL